MVQPTTRPPKTVQDDLALPDDVRAELIAGELYAQNGVAEYWIVDPADRSVEVFTMEGEAYAPRRCFTEAAHVVSPTLLGLALTADGLFPA